MELAQDVHVWWWWGGVCREASAPFVEHKSHLSQIRTGAALVLFDVPLGRGLGGVQMREVECGVGVGKGGHQGWGSNRADCWSTNRCSRLIL